MRCLLACVRSKSDADFCQAVLNCTLKVNYETIIQDEDETLIELVRSIQRASEKNHEQYEDLLNHNLCMISHFTGVQIKN